MNGIISEIRDFYFFYHTSAEITGGNPSGVIKTSLCKRTDFVNAAFDALVFLVYNVGLTVFSAIAVVATVGLIPSLKACLYKNAYESMVHAGSISVSLIGIISPQTINQDFLKLTAREFQIEIKPDTKKMVGLLGGIVLRQRRPVRVLPQPL